LIQHQAGNEVDNQVFSKANFTVTPYVQYVILPIQNSEQLFRQFNENARRNIKKADKHLEMVEDTAVDTLQELITLSYQRHQIPYTTGLEVVQRIHQALLERDQGIVWTAKDDQGRIHASILLAWDHQTMYYLAGGLDHRIPQVGASRWLLWKAINKAQEMGLAFNFGGGLTPSIDTIYQSMQGLPVPWVRMTYTSSPLLEKGIQMIKKVMHRKEDL
jgi:lipid II:glycine glycyltransferase (peptidoglycan interpeptide bridge formation enzyme)